MDESLSSHLVTYFKSSIPLNQNRSFKLNIEVLIYPKLYINTITDVVIAKKVSYIIQHNLKGIFHLGADDVINYKELYNLLIIGLGFNNVNMEENYEEEGYFAILSNRNNEFPEQLGLINKLVITYLSN